MGLKQPRNDSPWCPSPLQTQVMTPDKISSDSTSDTPAATKRRARIRGPTWASSRLPSAAPAAPLWVSLQPWSIPSRGLVSSCDRVAALSELVLLRSFAGKRVFRLRLVGWYAGLLLGNGSLDFHLLVGTICWVVRMEPTKDVTVLPKGSTATKM